MECILTSHVAILSERFSSARARVRISFNQCHCGRFTSNRRSMLLKCSTTGFVWSAGRASSWLLVPTDMCALAVHLHFLAVARISIKSELSFHVLGSNDYTTRSFLFIMTIGAECLHWHVHQFSLFAPLVLEATQDMTLLKVSMSSSSTSTSTSFWPQACTALLQLRCTRLTI